MPCMHTVRSYGGQFAFVEVINAMQRPAEFASAVRASTAVMGTAYVALGGIGYWSMGAVVPSVIIFGIGSGLFARLAANAILAQARLLPCSLPLINSCYACWARPLRVPVGQRYSACRRACCPSPYSVVATN